MVSRKYAGDYRLENHMDTRGRLKTVAVYRGKDYFFTDSRAEEPQTRRLLALAAALLWPLLLLPLIPQSLAGHTMWVVLPFILALLPALFLSMSVWNYLRAKQPMHREIADRISGRIPACSLITAILTAVSFVGEIVNFIVRFSRIQKADFFFAPCAALACAAALWAHILSRRLKTAPAPEAPAPVPEIPESST